MIALHVLDCGAGLTIQDHGRYGYQRYGVGPAGAMDREALALANMLVGNADGAAALEFMLVGGRFRLEGGDALVALQGAEAILAIDGEPAPRDASVLVRDGQTLALGPARKGVFMTLALAGGIDTAPALGSRALHRRAGLGGVEGRPVRPGDRLPLGPTTTREPKRLDPPFKAPAGAPLRILLGPQDDYFSDEAAGALLSATFHVSSDADRMGYRLEGPKIPHARGYNIVSDGIVTGSIQIPGNGQPIVLLADRQTTGGYPKFGAVITTDLDRFASLGPGDAIRFQKVSRSDAVAAARARAARIEAARASLRPLDGGLSPERLLRLNLVDGFIDAYR